MIPTKVQLHVLQRLADRVDDPTQFTRSENVLNDLRNHPRTDESFPDQDSFDNIVNELIVGGLIERRLIKGNDHVRLTEAGAEVEGLRVLRMGGW